MIKKKKKVYASDLCFENCSEGKNICVLEFCFEKKLRIVVPEVLGCSAFMLFTCCNVLLAFCNASSL